MKKLKSLSIVPIILLSSVNAETFKINLDKKHQEAITVEVFVDKNEPLVCESPLVLNDTEDNCIDPIEEVNWINTSDSCGGLAPSYFNPKVVLARSKSGLYPSSALEIPKGYRWLSSSEWKSLYDSGIANSNLTYHGKCGVSGYPRSLNEDIPQYWSHFNDGKSIHSGHAESTDGTHYNYTGQHSNFLGYVLYKED
jgi:hypothetical protein